jgi:hypothetical protein
LRTLLKSGSIGQIVNAEIRTMSDHSAGHLRRFDPRESQRSDLAESGRCRGWWHLVSTLRPGVSDATVVDGRYIRFFTHRNSRDDGCIMINNQRLNISTSNFFCDAKNGFRLVMQKLSGAVTSRTGPTGAHRAAIRGSFCAGPNRCFTIAALKQAT